MWSKRFARSSACDSTAFACRCTSQIRNSPAVFEAYERTKAEVGNERRRWHGTSCTEGCTFAKDVTTGGSRGAPCGNNECRLCNIAASGFELGHAGATGGQRMNLRYGPGLYFSSTSSKSNDYNEGSESDCFQFGTARKRMAGGALPGRHVRRRCLFLCKVALGTPFVARDDGFAGGNEGWSQDQVDDALMQHDSVTAIPGQTPNINYDEQVVYRSDQAIPSYVVVYDL
eukprot:SAG31_NODE_1877_length_7007_cov_3.257093_2_plen_229_part_00